MMTLFIKEIRFHVTDFKLLLLVPLFVILSYLSANFNTTQYVERQETTHALLQKSDADLRTTLAYGAIKVIVARPESPLAIFYNGAASQFGRVTQIKVDAAIDALQPQPGLGRNPYLSNLFKLDWVHIIVWLFSLIAILMGHDVISREKEEGTLRLLWVSRLSLPRIVAVKLMAGGVILAISLTLSFVATWVPLLLRADIQIGGTDVLGGLVLWICAFWYGAFWLMLSCYLSYWTLSSSRALMAGLLFWMICTIGAPALKLRLLGDPYFIKENNRCLDDYRSEWNVHQSKIDNRFMPLWEKGEYSCSMCGSLLNPSFMYNKPTWDVRVAALKEIKPMYRKGFQSGCIEKQLWEPILSKEKWVGLIDYLNPSGLMEKSAGRLTDIDIRSHFTFLKNVRNYLGILDTYFESNRLYESPLWFGPEKTINQFFTKHPEFNRRIDFSIIDLYESEYKAELDRLLSLKNVIDVEGLPRFNGKPVTWLVRTGSAFTNILLLVLLNGALLGVLFVSLKGQSIV